MKPLVVISLLSAALLSSCSVVERLTTPGEYTPIYLEEPTPLDPPGMDAIRAEARAKYVKEGLYKDGETLEVQQGKAFLFNRNPDYYEGAKGRMVQAAQATIISCEGLYYFVKLDEGSKGFLRETDFVNPVKLVSNSLENLLPEESWETPGSMDGEQQIMTNTNGRAVLVVKKTSKKTDEFNARRRELLNKQSAAPADDTALPTPTEELPEPAGSAGE